MKRFVVTLLLILAASVIINGLSLHRGSHLDRTLRFSIQQPYNAGRKIGCYVYEWVREEREGYRRN